VSRGTKLAFLSPLEQSKHYTHRLLRLFIQPRAVILATVRCDLQIGKSFLLESECVNLLKAAIAHQQNLATRGQPKPLCERINELRKVFQAQDFF